MLTADFRYTNPITEGLDPQGIRDCQIFRDGDRWCMTGTAWPFWFPQEVFGILNPGVVLYDSSDLIHWRFVRILIPRPERHKWWYRRFWAPEIHRLKGRYYVTFNCCNPDIGIPDQHFGYAVGDSLEGPFEVVTDEKPLGMGNDLTLFEDEDGSVWAFWNRGRDFGIGFAPVDLAAGSLLAKPITAILPGSVEALAERDPKTGRTFRALEWDSEPIEGPFIFKREGTYYLLYSSPTRGYEIGCATSQKITGPWVKHPSNPWYGAQKPEFCKLHGIAFTGDLSHPFECVGHNAVFTGPDGRLWLSCHGNLRSQPKLPMLVIDPINFRLAGGIVQTPPTWTPQQVRC
jgi:beta-xylosidase